MNKVYVLVGNRQLFGVFTTERRAKARQQELQRVGVYAAYFEGTLNESVEVTNGTSDEK